MSRGKKKGIKGLDKGYLVKEGRLSGQYKRSLTDKLVNMLDLEDLSKVQMRRVLSYAYQSLREGR